MGERPRRLSREQQRLWARIQEVRGELVGSEDRHCEFDKLSVEGDVSVWRAWLDECVVQLEAGECKDEAVDCAFRFAWRVLHARTLRGEAGNCGKKLVRELGLVAFKKQHEHQVLWYRTVFDEELIDRLVAAGLIEKNGGERECSERAGAVVVVVERATGSARREADAGTGSAASSVLVSAEEVQGGPVLRNRSVLGMGGRGDSGRR